VFDRSTATGTGDAEPTAAPVTGAVPAGERVDLGRVLTGLRHLPAGEPARVFTELAAVCVPALCDECWIEIVEQGGHRYRIRRPGPGQSAHRAATNGAAAEATGAALGAAAWSGNGAAVTVSGGSVLARFGNPPGGGPGYTGEMVCIWRRGHLPSEADAALVGVLVDHATALVHRDRTTARVADAGTAGQVRLALDGTQRVAAATGILMALYHLSPAQARQLLARAGDRTHRTLREVADTVLQTGALPGPDGRPVDQSTARATPVNEPEPPEPDDPLDEGHIA
jgi:hypothetical protein